MSRHFVPWLEAKIFAHRQPVLGSLAIATLVLAVAATQLRIDAGFAKWLPLEHPYMETFLRYQDAFGGANRLLIAVRAREGDIFRPEILKRLERITRAVQDLPGIDRSRVRSIFTPDTRFVEIVEGGFTGGNVVPAEFRPVPEEIEGVRENVLKAGLVGQLVANDFSAAMVSAELVGDGLALDPLELARLVENEIRQPFSDEWVEIHIIGFAKAVGEIAEGTRAVVGFFAAAFATTALLVYAFTRSVPLTLLPLACSLLAVVWSLGLLRLLGYGLDPMSILVPFLIFAIGVSHGLQMINVFAAELRAGHESLGAARVAFRRLLVPGGAALLSDAAGFLTILLIQIPILRELAITAALGVLVLVLTNLVLLPLALSYLAPGPARARAAAVEVLRATIARSFSGFARPGLAVPCLLLALALLAFALPRAAEVRIGDLQAGLPELAPDSRYNRDAEFITGHFAIGLDVLKVVAETVPDGCVDHAIMAEIDHFQWQMANVPGVQSTLSLPQVAKIVNAGWNEGSLAWRVLPRDPGLLAQAISPVETGTGLLNADCSAMPVLIFTADHAAETIARVVGAIEGYVQEDGTQGRLTFRLASGNLGVMAATNQVVEAAQFPMLVYIYAAVAALCWLAFRSLRALLCIMLPLGLVSVLVYALMSLLGIGLKVATLPVAALGVGIGVDYGIYVFAQLKHGLARGLSVADAYARALRVAGTAVLLTGATLTIAVGTWLFSPLQFQADMGLLLAFTFCANMLGALFLLPALALILYASIPSLFRRPAL